MKVLPKADFESDEDAKYISPKVHSRRHTIKCMFLGVVSHPDMYEDSDGKIMIKRVSKKSQSKAVSITKSFVSDYIVNDNIKNGEWHKFFPDSHDMSVGEAMELICEHYQIDKVVSTNLYFSYTSYDRNKKVKKLFGWMDILATV